MNRQCFLFVSSLWTAIDPRPAQDFPSELVKFFLYFFLFKFRILRHVKSIQQTTKTLNITQIKWTCSFSHGKIYIGWTFSSAEKCFQQWQISFFISFLPQKCITLGYKSERIAVFLFVADSCQTCNYQSCYPIISGFIVTRGRGGEKWKGER